MRAGGPEPWETWPDSFMLLVVTCWARAFQGSPVHRLPSAPEVTTMSPPSSDRGTEGSRSQPDTGGQPGPVTLPWWDPEAAVLPVPALASTVAGGRRGCCDLRAPPWGLRRIPAPLHLPAPQTTGVAGNTHSGWRSGGSARAHSVKSSSSGVNLEL